jgi:hypothetical protein
MNATILRFTAAVVASAALVSSAFAQEIRNWPAPLRWSPPEKTKVEAPDQVEPTGQITAVTPLTFVAVIPCRLVDTRPESGFPVGYGAPALLASATREFDLNSAAHCPGIPATAGAYSLNFTVIAGSGVFTNAFLTAWPTGDPRPLVSTLNFNANQLEANAAIVPSGMSGAINVFVNAPTHLLIDVNGYYADEFPNVTRSVHVPLLSFIGCTGGTPTLLDTTSGPDTSPDVSYFSPTGGLRLFFDIDPGFEDQNSRICSEFLVPPDYVSSGEFRVVADKGGNSGASEVLNCAAGVGMIAEGLAGGVVIDADPPTEYVCAPTLPALTPGQRVHFSLSIVSGATMDNVVLLLGVQFEYKSSQ